MTFPPPKWDPQAYRTYRPQYPPSLYDFIISHGGEDSARALAVDVGAGTGQATLDLASRFTNVIGIDPSPELLASAFTASNIDYRVGSADDTGIEDNSVDLVTAAAALHWFNIPRFFKEAHRIIKPRTGVVACWCYNATPSFKIHVGGNNAATTTTQNQAAQKVHEDTKQLLWKYMDPRLHTAMSEGYRPYVAAAQSVFINRNTNSNTNAAVEFVHHPMSWTTSINGMVGWVRSWSPFTAYKKEMGEEAGGALEEGYRRGLMEALMIFNVDAPLIVVFDLDVIIAKKV